MVTPIGRLAMVTPIGRLALILGCLCGCFSSLLTAGERSVKVMVQAMVTPKEGSRLVEVDVARDEAAKAIETYIKKKSNYLLANRKHGEPDPSVLILLGVESQRIVPASELRPDVPQAANLLACVINTKAAVMVVGAKDRLPEVREHREGGLSCETAAERIADDLIAWIKANTERF